MVVVVVVVVVASQTGEVSRQIGSELAVERRDVDAVYVVGRQRIRRFIDEVEFAQDVLDTSAASARPK